MANTGLRHTFATLGLEAGVDVLYVSELLKHSSPAITQAVYQHVRRDRLGAASERISADLRRHAVNLRAMGGRRTTNRARAVGREREV